MTVPTLPTARRFHVGDRVQTRTLDQRPTTTQVGTVTCIDPIWDAAAAQGDVAVLWPLRGDQWAWAADLRPAREHYYHGAVSTVSDLDGYGWSALLITCEDGGPGAMAAIRALGYSDPYRVNALATVWRNADLAAEAGDGLVSAAVDAAVDLADYLGSAS